MSLQALGWAWRLEELQPTEKLVLLALADAHNETTGRCFPSRDLLARRACVSVETVKRCLRQLEDRGVLRRVASFDGEGRQRSNEYELAFDSQLELTSRGVAGDPLQGVAGVPLEGVVGEPGEGVVGDPHNRKKEPEEDPTHPSLPRVVDRVRVAELELQLATAVLACWNERTHQQLRAPGWITKIIRRHREWPELTIGDHELVITSELDHPWWKGTPSPAVVYGSAEQFEQCLARWRAQSDNEHGSQAERFRRLLDKGRAA